MKFKILFVVLFCCAVYAEQPQVFVSRLPLEPDKCISAWLIKKFVNTNATFQFIENESTVTNGILFDMPGAKYIRTHRQCASESVITYHSITNKKAIALAKLARKIEIAYWSASFSTEEQKFVDSLHIILASNKTPEQKCKESFQLAND